MISNYNNEKSIMKECSKIVVEKGSPGVGGIFTANYSEIGICDTGWAGIEVQGWIDACPTSNIHGQFIANHTTIKHADIAVFSGVRVSPNPSVDRRYFGGGIIQLDYCHFEDNYVDVMFSEYQEAGACSNSCPKCWQSHGFNNTFVLSKAIEHCDNFASNTASLYGLNICHIVDFNLKPNIWSFPNFCPGPLYCDQCATSPPNKWSLDLQNQCNPPGAFIWNFNTYDAPCSNPKNPYK